MAQFKPINIIFTWILIHLYCLLKLQDNVQFMATENIMEQYSELQTISYLVTIP